MPPLVKLPPVPSALALIAAAFVLPGLAGHDLWKSHDAIGLGIVHDMALRGDLLVPHIAGMPWLEDPPLYHWVALGFGTLLGPLLEFHAAARLASGALMLAAFGFVYLAARDWSAAEDRRTSAAAAVLILLGSIGLMVHAHEALPELASLAALCGALATLPYAARRPLAAGVAFGAALGLALMADGWIVPASLALAVAAGHAICPEWRTRRAAPFVGVALVVALALAASWPLALASRHPELAAAWRQAAFAPHGEAATNLRYFLATGSWFAWPAWPLALWAAWSMRRRWSDPRLFVPACAVAVALVLLAAWGPAQDVVLIPLLAPLALLAAHGVFALRRGAAAALDWFGVLTFAFFAFLVWLGYFAMQTGVPPRLARNLGRQAPGFEAELDLLPLAFALLLTAGWLYSVFFTAPSPVRSVARWAGGIVLLWGSVAMLWMPWVDYQKSYRAVALQLRASVPPGEHCIAQRSLGMAQAAALAYHGGIRTRPLDPLDPQACGLLLVQGHPSHEYDGPDAAWEKLADVGRPGDRSERYRLYRLNR
jgi:4-amino-4-deoxy-L-arabinose transferase-like glycosyltransferase